MKTLVVLIDIFSWKRKLCIRDVSVLQWHEGIRANFCDSPFIMVAGDSYAKKASIWPLLQSNESLLNVL